ncbi:autotransporter assembly complex protein TamA [Thiocystis violascens]|uniref:Translocation and assembly module subunit TamA n=1 Tax=Thiocystis violascens (strain ATCC 17096 / DSM 198 / 6111) TaxID=765911 RepID=I3YHA7_THIV6|nr:autotransporter assembly complex family protein [Thiocystis violascens]AFL76375.1 outer membrane protein [Thiocystis violascens DSM 198]
MAWLPGEPGWSKRRLSFARRSGQGLFVRLLLVGLLLPTGLLHALTLDVKVEGLEGQPQANVLALLAIYQERDDRDLIPERILGLHRLAPEQIREALAPFGFYRVAVEDRLEPAADPNGRWTAVYRVNPGEPIKIGSVTYQVTGEGADNPGFPKEFPMRVGDVLLHSVYEKAKADLRYTASQEGYLDAQLLRHQVLVDPVAYDARIEFHLDTGPQYRIGKVRFQQDLLDEDLLRRYVKFKPGVVYDPDLLLGLQGRLLGSEYYSDVEIVPLTDQAGPNHEIPIEVIAKRNLPNKYRIGLGYATDVGPRLSMDWRRRYLNRWGHKLRTELSLAPALSNLELDYRIPIQDPTRDYIIIKPQSTYTDTATRKGWVHSVQAAHSTLTPRGWRRNLGLDYRYEDLELASDSSDALGATSELVPTLSWSKTVSDDPINTNRGYRIKYTLLGAVQGLISEASYLSGQIQFKWVRRFAERYRVITRTDLGATLADSVDDLPASRRFYAGGDNSIRGWGFDALGPNDPVTDAAVGGRYLAVGSLELERQIKGPWSAAIFTDFGNAFDPDYEQRFAQSAGFGVRWASPIGQVRLDLAFALTKDQGDDEGGLPPARLHIVIGPDL